MSTRDCADVRIALGALALGTLDADEERQVRRHLSECRDCLREADELMGPAGALALVDRDQLMDPPEPSTQLLPGLLSRVAAARRQSRRRRRVAGLVAAAVAAIALVAVGIAAFDRSADPPVAAPVSSVSGSDGAIGLDVDIWDRDWGTAVEVAVTGVPGGYRCSLVAIGMDGARETAATWVVPDAGYNGGGSLVVEGGLALRSWEIERYEIVTTDGEVLVTAHSSPSSE